MTKQVKIAIDAMGGENSPKKIIDGINISLKSSEENFFYLYGDEKILKEELSKNKKLLNFCEIINTKDVILDDTSFCMQLLSSEYVATVPGSSFGSKDSIRISYALSEKDLRIGCKRIKDFCERLV